MKLAAIVVGIAEVASAHYFFDKCKVHGVTSAPLQYIRGTTRPISYNPIKFSSTNKDHYLEDSTIDGVDSRCNQGAFTFAQKTEVMSIDAGTEVTFELGFEATMRHPGPGLVYMSRAPNDDVKAYDGSGDWFKIFQEGVCDKNKVFGGPAWCTWDRNWIAATIPKDTPDGEYLLRVEHIGLHGGAANQPEHFVSCMQVKVTSGGTGTPGPLVKFPGAYKKTDPYANFNIYGGYTEFTFPGPAVWGGGESGSG